MAVIDGSGQQQIVQVVTREDGGQMLVQVSPEQLQGQLVAMQQDGQIVAGEGQGQRQVVVPTSQSNSNQVVIGQGQGGQMFVVAAPHNNQIAAQPGQVVVAATPQGGQMVVAAAAPGAQGNQVVFGQGQAGQVLATAPQNNQVVVGQGQSSQMMVAAAAVPKSNQVVLGQDQSGQMILQQANTLLAGQGQYVVAAPQQTMANQESAGSVVVQENESQDIIRGGQLVQIADQDQYGILSRDGSKLMLVESKEAAIATLQAASAQPDPQAAHLFSPAPPSSQHSISPLPSSLYSSPALPSNSTSFQASPSHELNSRNIKKELFSPDAVKYDGTATAHATGVLTPPPPSQSTSLPSLPEAVAPATIGQSTSAAVTTDSSRPADNQEVSALGKVA